MIIQNAESLQLFNAQHALNLDWTQVIFAIKTALKVFGISTNYFIKRRKKSKMMVISIQDPLDHSPIVLQAEGRFLII